MKEIEKDPQRIIKLILLLINIIKKEWTTHKKSWLEKNWEEWFSDCSWYFVC